LNNFKILYISGTAAIRGESSVFDDDIADQIYITIENIENLLSSANFPEGYTLRDIQMCRIYVKNRSQMEVVDRYFNENFPGLKSSLVCAEICRDELLLEIEGIAMTIH